MPTIPKLKKTSKPKDPNQILDRKARQKIYNDKRWHYLRDQHIQREPLCYTCQLEGKVKLGEEVHHLFPFPLGRTDAERKALAFDPNNIVTLCKYCHWRCHHGDLSGTRTREDIVSRLKKLQLYKPTEGQSL